MDVILTHRHMDFDALASAVAASRLYPEARLVLQDDQSEEVNEYLALFKDEFPFVSSRHIDWDDLHTVILTDVSEPDRARDGLAFSSAPYWIIYDHHTNKETPDSTEASIDARIEPTGAAVTILIEELMQRQLSLTPVEATLFALGLYTDTGSLVYPSTTLRDLQAAVFLMEQGMNLDTVGQYMEDSLSPDQQYALRAYLGAAEVIEREGLQLLITKFDSGDKHIGGLNTVTSNLIETTGASAVITLTRAQGKIFVIGRSATDRIHLPDILAPFGGGGHSRAGSATIKDQLLDDVYDQIKSQLQSAIGRSITAEELMSRPVKTLKPETTIREAEDMVLRYGHSGFPVVNDQYELVGIISRRDIDKAMHHQLGHAPVKGYMSSNLHTAAPYHRFEELQQQMVHHNVGRLPIIDHRGALIGLVSRSDIIARLREDSTASETVNMEENMRMTLPDSIQQWLRAVGEEGARQHLRTYLIGGVVRDIILQKENEDIDIAVEGDGIAFASDIASKWHGELHKHEAFGTATITWPDGLKMDIASSRTEFYEKPGSLPDVESSTLKEDLFRRDFTINAMALALHPEEFGDLIDHFSGLEDLKRGAIRVLHNLSFVEDPTRILRAVRFEHRFGFAMDHETEAFIAQAVNAIHALSTDRILAEFQRLTAEMPPAQLFYRLQKLDVLSAFLPGAVWDDPAERLLPYITSLQSSLFMILLPLFLQESGRVLSAERVAVRKQDKQLVRHVHHLLDESWDASIEKPGDFHRTAAHVSPLSVEIAAYCLEYSAGHPEKAALLRQYQDKWQDLPSWVSGAELQRLGLRPGPLYKFIISETEKGIINEEITSSQEALDYAESLIHSYQS
jgi:tRNA nucleotidyltransferase (CCA-adding enzyme)